MPPATRQDAAHTLPTPGQVIAGKYAIVKVLGEGGMGVVYEATHLKLRQRVAVKMLLPDMLQHEIVVTRFEREARASSQLRSRHVPRVMDVDSTPEGIPYMVMEFLEGHDLQRELEHLGRLPVETAVDYMLQTCSAMVEAHQVGIIHRDLKPANLFLAIDGDARIIKVLDFGISKVQSEGDAKLTTAESVIGTAMYMSPEQLRSAGAVDARSDIWSLGIILYELLAGRAPWIGTPTQLAAAIVTEDAPDIRSHAEIPIEIAAILAKALRRDPAERFPDVKQFALALAPFAPPSGAGHIFADALLNNSSGMFPRVSIRPQRMEDAQTLVQAAAVSQSRTGGENNGTAPGWSQHSPPATRKRTLLLGFVIAFAVALVVVGGLAMAWLRWGSGAAAERAAAAQAASMAAQAASAPPSAPAVPADPAPPPADPAPPMTGQSASPAPPDSAAAAHPRAPAGRPAGAAPTRRAPAAPGAPAATGGAKPAAPQGENPLHL